MLIYLLFGNPQVLNSNTAEVIDGARKNIRPQLFMSFIERSLHAMLFLAPTSLPHDQFQIGAAEGFPVLQGCFYETQKQL